MTLLQMLAEEIQGARIAFKWTENIWDTCWIFYDGYWSGYMSQSNNIIKIKNVLGQVLVRLDMSDPTATVGDVRSAIWRCYMHPYTAPSKHGDG